MHNNELGQWAVIDIETSGIDPLNDSIIDVGFLRYEGVELVETYQSLVRFPMTVDRHDQLSLFIQKLTGIKPEMLKKAPRWEEVVQRIQELEGHTLLAHNADFEKSFLDVHFEDVGAEVEYADSLPFLGLLYPEMGSLSLENFIVNWGLADKEIHRGFQDSVDLLKVLLVAVWDVNQRPELAGAIDDLFRKHELENYWYTRFFRLGRDELLKLAASLDFDLEAAHEKAFAEEVRELEETPFSDLAGLDFNGDAISAALKNEEAIRKVVPHYSYRESQKELALKTGQSFKNRVHSLVQAPTGTGKTLGYLLPASLFSLKEEKQVLMATGTKALQHQAMSKDIPQLKKLLGKEMGGSLNVKRLVGSGNHYCELLFRQETEEDLLSGARPFEEKFADMFLERVFYHNAVSSPDDRILRDDIPWVLKRKYPLLRERDKQSAVDFRSCTGNKCPFKTECTYINGLREAKEADIIVGNHALMFSWPKGFPRPEYVIVDEAHKIEGEATRAYAAEVEENDLEGLSKSLRHLQGIGSLFYILASQEEEEGESTPVINRLRDAAHSCANMLDDHLKVMPDAIELFFKKRPRYSDAYWNELPMVRKSTSQNDPLAISILNHFESLKNIIVSFYQDLLPYIGRWEARNLEDDNLIIALTRFETFVAQMEDIMGGIDRVLDEESDKDCRTIRYHQEYGYAIQSSPIDVGRVLHDGLLQTSASVVFTSATLGNAHGDKGIKGVEWSTGYLYLDPARRFKSAFFLPPVYDYANNTKVFLCDDVPNLYDASFVPYIMNELIPMLKNVDGGALLLFSARKRFEIAREILLEKLEGSLPLFIQGMGNQVVEEFKKSGRGVLLGMETFGEGIDVPGDALKFVFIDKIPDLRMDKVIQDRRDFFDKAVGNEFTDYYMAHRSRSLHQKLGRLLRTESDRGAVIIVDSRIKRWKGATMGKFLQLLEPYKVKRESLEKAVLQVEDFLEPRADKGVINPQLQDCSDI